MTGVQNTDSPSDAKAAEEGKSDSGKYDNGTPSQTEEAEKTEREPKSSGNAGSKGTFQDAEDEKPRPTDMGKARDASVVSHSYVFTCTCV